MGENCVCRRVGTWTRPTDGKIKALPSGRGKWLVGLDLFVITFLGPGVAFARNAKFINCPSDAACRRDGISAHDWARRRPSHPSRPHSSRQPGRQATEELRRGGDAGRKEGGPRRRQLPLEPGPQPVTVRPGPARGGLDQPAVRRPARGDEGARRAPSWGSASARHRSRSTSLTSSGRA